MIYVILDDSHNWDDITSEPVIEYITTDKVSANTYFDKHCENDKDMSDDKWYYGHKLIEYRDGWDTWSKDSPTILRESSNVKDEDE